MTSFSSIQSLNFSRIENINVKNGYVLYSQPFISNTNIKLPNIATGGSYQKGNIIYDLSDTSNNGTIIGCPTLEDIPIDIIYNYPVSLIPGFYPDISGKWSQNQDYYNLDNILNSEKKVSKALGTGLGTIESYQVSDVCRSGLSTMSFSTDIGRDSLGNLKTSSLFEILRTINFSSNLNGYNYPQTTLGTGEYMSGFDWLNKFGIETINGTNTFPFMGWSGTRIGTLKPQNFQYLQNSLFSYPAFYLDQAKLYNPLGIIYPGQAVQMNSFPITSNERKLSFNERNDRTYQIPIYNKFEEIRKVGLVPYQEGRGIFDFMSRDIIYNPTNGLVDIANTQTLIPPEGAIAGRNVSFWGMSISDTWSDTIDMNNIVAGSQTKKDTRTIMNQSAHNAPLCYISEIKNNSNDSIPWNPLFGYIGDTTSSSTNKRSSNCHIIREGITTGIISGAYPIYRGGFSSIWSGVKNSFVQNNGIVLHDNYYTSNEFWNPQNIDPATPQIKTGESSFPVQPNPPYRIKGGKIVLFEGQRIKAGSYVYATMNMIQNVTIPQFFPPGAKEIILEEGERDNIISDVYSKFQANQGGLIVMVTNDEYGPPNPPSNAIPIGVVLEDIVGYGSPEYYNDNIQENIEYENVYNTEEVLKTFLGNLQLTKAKITPRNVCQIQARDILFRLFPMTPQLTTNSISTLLINSFIFFFSQPYTVSFGNFNYAGQWDVQNHGAYQPVFNRVRTNYYLPPGIGGFKTEIDNFNLPRIEINGWGWKEKESRNDYPQI